MRILLLVPRHFRKLEDFKTDVIWDETSLPIYQAHNYWYKALKSLGHDVALCIYSGKNPALDYWSIMLKNAFEKIKFGNSFFSYFAKTVLPVYSKQRELLEVAKTFRPELVIFSGNTDNAFPETFLEIKKKYKSKLVLLNGLSPVISATKSEKILAEYFDYVFTNDEYHAIDWLMLGAKHALALPVSAIDPDVCKLHTLTLAEKRELGSDVSFVGSIAPYNRYKDRIAFLEQLTDFNLKIWTYDRDVVLANQRLKKCYAGEASDVKMFKIFQVAKISLNFHGHSMPSGGNIRTFEIPGSGGFELVDRTNPQWYKIGKEVVTFKNVADLRKKITYYLEHDKLRIKIAKASYLRTIKDHTYKNRFINMLKLLYQNS